MMSATNAGTSFDEVIEKIRQHVPPPRTDAQRKAREAAPALPAPDEPADGEPARSWFRPPVEEPRARQRKVCFEVDDDLAERFRKLCFGQRALQRRVIAQLMTAYVEVHGRPA